MRRPACHRSPGTNWLSSNLSNITDMLLGPTGSTHVIQVFLSKLGQGDAGSALSRSQVGRRIRCAYGVRHLDSGCHRVGIGDGQTALDGVQDCPVECRSFCLPQITSPERPCRAVCRSHANTPSIARCVDRLPYKNSIIVEVDKGFRP